MGREANGIRIISTNMERGLMTILIDGVTEQAKNPGDSILYAWEIDPSRPKPTDDQTLAKFRLPSRYVQSDDPEIAALAVTITNGKNGDYEKARAIHQWAAGNIWYNYDWLNGVADTSAVGLEGEETWSSTYILRNKRGVCEGYASLTAALLRAVDIPAKYMSGQGQTGAGGVVPHGWLEAYADARWINMDPTWDSKNRFENGRFSSQQAPGSAWFDVPDEEFSKTHTSNVYAQYILENGLAAER
jgi:transglutaminase-like putative cysteine protease